MAAQTDAGEFLGAASTDPQAAVARLLGKVHNIDCLDLMRSMPDELVNIVFADPPFNLNKKYASYQDNIPFSPFFPHRQGGIFPPFCAFRSFVAFSHAFF